MKTLSEMSGLSARRETIDKRSTKTSRIGILCAFMFTTMFLLSSCNEKTKGQSNPEKNNHAAVMNDSTNKPKVNIQVNRRFDDKGNLIGFDSTYSTFYSNIKGDTSRMDSLMSHFDRYFQDNHSSMFNNQFNSLFFDDSLRYPDFFHNDFFMKRYELNDAYLRDMMHRMDSIKNNFYDKEPKSRR
jgi:hypothetical protein